VDRLLVVVNCLIQKFASELDLNPNTKFTMHIVSGLSIRGSTRLPPDFKEWGGGMSVPKIYRIKYLEIDRYKKNTE
jgi:hypothetical protein